MFSRGSFNPPEAAGPIGLSMLDTHKTNSANKGSIFKLVEIVAFEVGEFGSTVRRRQVLLAEGIHNGEG